MRTFFVFLLCVLIHPLLADEEETHDILFEKRLTPWFTGPLIAPSAFTVTPGHFTLQAYLDSFVDIGVYDSHWQPQERPNFYNTNLRLRIKAGIAKWLDAQITSQASHQETQGKNSTGFNDLLFAFNIQLLTFKMEDPWPALKLVLHTSIPSGKYQQLNPSLKMTDARGTGCWYPEAALVASKVWNLSDIHYLEVRLFTAYRMGVPTSVRGLSVYGGDISTRGTAYPGNIFVVDGAIECNFTKNFAFACDIYYLHRNRSHFSGSTLTAATQPSREQWSLAPALEYNWSKNLGVIGGVWFSLAGRNGPQFINGILSLNSYF